VARFEQIGLGEPQSEARVRWAAVQPETTHLIRESDARDLSFIDDASVHLVCTRPPYGSLKAFPDGPGQLGDIADYDEFLAELEKVWRTSERPADAVADRRGDDRGRGGSFRDQAGTLAAHRCGQLDRRVAVRFWGGDVRFVDRHDAGRRLAVRLADIRGEALVVVGIPRGGVAVAAEVAGALGAPLDVVVVRKIGAPGKPEYAIGALAEGDVSVISDEAVRGVGLGAVDLDVVVARVRREHSSTGLLWRAAHDAKSLRSYRSIECAPVSPRERMTIVAASRRLAISRIVFQIGPMAARVTVCHRGAGQRAGR
jgi:hypothetical protein